MKRLTLLITIFLAALPCLAQKPAVDETLEYSVVHSMSTVPIATMTMSAVRIDGGRTYLAATVESEPSFQRIYTLNAQYYANVDPATMKPLTASHTLLEKNYWRTVDYAWKSRDNSCTAKIYRKGEADLVDVPIFGGGDTRDVLTMVWYLRWLPYRAGEVYDLGRVVAQRTSRAAYLNKAVHRTAWVNGARRAVIEVVVFVEKDITVSMTLTDDEARLPLRFEAQLPFGRVEGSLLREEDLGFDEREVMLGLGLKPEKKPVTVRMEKAPRGVMGGFVPEKKARRRVAEREKILRKDVLPRERKRNIAEMGDMELPHDMKRNVEASAAEYARAMGSINSATSAMVNTLRQMDQLNRY